MKHISVYTYLIGISNDQNTFEPIDFLSKSHENKFDFS